MEECIVECLTDESGKEKLSFYYGPKQDGGSNQRILALILQLMLASKGA